MSSRALAFLFAAWPVFAVDTALLKTSRDPKILLQTAVECAASVDAVQLDALRDALASSTFLARLDSREEYLAPPRQLRLARVIEALTKNPAGHRVLVALAGERVFTSFEPRQELLIRALAAVRPAPEPALAFWKRHSTPGAPYLTVTIDALADNLSPPALALLESKLTDAKMDREDRIAWMRDAVLRHRDNLDMLKMCERLLTGPLAVSLRPTLVEALFDYREEWYLSDQPPKPPDWRYASSAAKAELRRIGQLALSNIQLTAAQQAAVRKTLSDLPAREP